MSKATDSRLRGSAIPPHDLDAEQSVLGAMLESKDVIASVVEIVQRGDFYKPAHDEVFDAILSLHARGEGADAVTLADELATRGKLEEMGGKPYILGLLEAYPTAGHAPQYARIVADCARRRRRWSLGQKIHLAESNGADPAAVDAMVAELWATRPAIRLPSAPTRRTMREILSDPAPEDPTLIQPAMMTRGGLTVLAAPTKVGKTNLWLHIAWALTEGRALFDRFVVPEPARVLMLQLELSEATIYRRLEALRDVLGWSEDAQDRFDVWCGRSLLLDGAEGAARIVDIIAEREAPDVVILDSYNAAVAGDPDRSAEARQALHTLRTVQQQTGATFGVTAEIRKQPAGTRSRGVAIDDLKGSNELAYDADAVILLRPGQDRRRLRLRFEAMRHATDEPPDNLVLVRRGLTFELTEGPGPDDAVAGGPGVDQSARIAEILAEHLKAGGKPTARACADAVRGAGVRASNEAIEAIRRSLTEGGV